MASLWNNPATLGTALFTLAGLLAVAAVWVALSRRRRTPRTVPPGSMTEALENRRFLLYGAVRGAIVVLTLALAACLALILVPESAIEKITRSIRSTRAAELPQPPVALLYLGDETKGKEFHIRGFVRNISTKPLDKLDASIRLYAPDGSLHQTALTRMDFESIAPDATAEFHLVYPEYAGQFTSYSVDFKLRNGDFLPYKDWRSARRSNQ